jgi:hypothetical protein
VVELENSNATWRKSLMEQAERHFVADFLDFEASMDELMSWKLKISKKNTEWCLSGRKEAPSGILK